MSQLRGAASLELSFLFESTGRGDELLTEVGVENFTRGAVKFAHVGGCALSKAERDAVWCALPAWLQEKLVERANEDAAPIEEVG